NRNECTQSTRIRKCSKYHGWLRGHHPSDAVMDIAAIIVIYLIDFVGSFVSGVVCIGGWLIKCSMLLYIPGLRGVAAFSSHEVSGISAVQVFFATIGGVWAYKDSG